MNVETPEDNRKREEARLTEEAYKLADGTRLAGFDPIPIFNAALQREQDEFRARRDAPISRPRWKNQDERKSKFPAEVRNQILDYVWETQKQLKGRGFFGRTLERKLWEQTEQKFNHLSLSYSEYRKTINGSSANTYARGIEYRAPKTIFSSC